MKTHGILLTVCLAFAFSARAQEVIKVETPVASAVERQTPSDIMHDFVRSEEVRACAGLKRFARENIFADPVFMTAARDRNTRAVAAAASKYAAALAKDYDTDFVFYHPNTRFFVRVNDKNYRGRMRLDRDAADSPSACFWERLPSQDVVYSVLMKIDGEKTGYLKMSKKLPRMVKNVPDALSQFGKVRVYTALDKTGLKKMAWFKMRRREPEKTKFSGWCTAEDLAFLTSIGSSEPLAKKQQKKLLKISDGSETFALPELNLTGGVMALNGLDGERLGAVVYTLGTAPAAEEKDDSVRQEETENVLYRFFE